MSTSGTYAYSPSIGSLALTVFGRCQIRRTEILPQHMEDLYTEANLLQSDWSADGILWWTVGLTSTTCTQGTATYTVTPSYVTSVLDVYISTSAAGQNRLITPFSRTDYASLANPAQQAFPTSYWFDRTLSPTLTLWPVPDGATTYTLNYYYYSQPEDAVIRQGGNAAVPYWWLNAYVAGLAHRMARIYAPALESQRERDYEKAYATASKQVEPSALYISPGLAGYYR